MKQQFTTTETFKYILVFTFLFAAFLALAVTYNKVYKMKNEIVSIIEKYEGVSNKSLTIVNRYLNNNGYQTMGSCKPNEYGIKDLETNDYELVTNASEKYYYCLSDYIVTNENKDKIYYNIKLFFKFNIPFIGDLLTFKITGETKGIQYYDNNQRLS